MIATTRRLDQLAAECVKLGIQVPADPSREQLFDLLRERTGTTDPSLELDPMKAQDTKDKVRWAEQGVNRFLGIRMFLTEDWVAEIKLDGCRLRLVFGLKANDLITGRRSVKTFAYTRRSDNFPHLRDATAPDLVGTILDGEILAPKASITTHTGMVTNSLLNSSVALCNSGPEGAVDTQRREGNAVFYVFDVLAVQGESVQGRPYDERRQMLELIVETVNNLHPPCNIKIVPQYPATVETIEECLAQGFEGVMLKKRTGVYQPGKRSSLWLKVKGFSTADAFVCGYNDGENANEGLVGSLNLAVDLGETSLAGTLGDELFIYVGPSGERRLARAIAQVGNLTLEFRREVTAADGTLRSEWYGRVCEFMAQGLGKNGRARHAHLVRLRPDKDQLDCKEDQLSVFPRV